VQRNPRCAKLFIPCYAAWFQKNVLLQLLCFILFGCTDKSQYSDVLHILFADMSMVINLVGNNPPLSYSQMLQLRSPLFASNTSTCLQLSYTALSYFSVRLACVTSNGTYSETLLYRFAFKQFSSHCFTNDVAHK